MDWLRQAKRNLLSARANMEYGLYEEVCFESHQAAEKALKALLQFLGIERRGHALIFLLREADKTGMIQGVPQNVRTCVLRLDKHYIPSRYPDVYDEGAPADYYSESDAEECLKCAEEVVEWVARLIKVSLQEI